MLVEPIIYLFMESHIAYLFVIHQCFDSRSAQALQGSSTTGGTGVVWMEYLQCTGSETSLAQCKRAVYDIGRANCGHTEDARVICS
jgi:Ni,Fe-hydrogenase I small subunit